MTEWKEYKLGEIVEIITGYPFPGDKYESTGNLRVVRGENVTIGNLRWDTEKHWNHETEGLEKYFLQSGDIVIGMDGSRVGDNRAKVKQVDLPLILAQRVACLRAKKEFSQDYLWYTIFSDNFKKYVEAIHTGTSIPHISQKQIEDFEILCPLLETQRRIAAILSSLDDKIDLLHRENATLEQMAETLFRQWFVVEAKEEWEEGKLTDYIKLIGGGTPKTTEESYWNGNVCWLSGGDIANNHKGFVSDSEKHISEIGLNNSAAKLLPENALVVSARGTVGKYCLLSKPMAFSQSNYGILPMFEDCYFFTYLLVAYHIDELQSAAYGSVFDTITTKTFEGVSVLLPKETGYIVEFEKMIELYFSKMKYNNNQIQTLIQTRDGLLPRLMSGEVKI